MADYISDSPNQCAPLGHSAGQRTPSSPHNHRSNRSRKHHPKLDGAVSDGAVANPNSSPRPKKSQAHKQRQSVAGSPAVPIQQDLNMGRGNGQKTRPVSVGSNLIPATPAKEQAYAASAFQASPAPSTLPMPKFFSKSVPNAAVPPSLLAAQIEESDQDGQTSSPGSDNISPGPPPREAQHSPLDLFFNAKRAEKERLQSGNFPMPGASTQPTPPLKGPRDVFRQSGKNLFMQELDGDDTGMPSPRTIPPNNRPPTIRQHSSPPVAGHTVANDQERLAQSKALKDQLFKLESASGRDHSRNSSGSHTPEGVFGSPSPVQRPAPIPATPQSAFEQQQSQYPLHYNNRMNLSPLFQKARADTPPRHSGLRQELPSQLVSNPDSFVTMPPPQRPAAGGHMYARTYLKEHIHASGPAEMPQLPFITDPSPVHSSGNRAGSGPAPINVESVNAQHGYPSSTTSRSNGSNDIKGMENDLRRMLKINNVLG